MRASCTFFVCVFLITSTLYSRAPVRDGESKKFKRLSGKLRILDGVATVKAVGTGAKIVVVGEFSVLRLPGALKKTHAQFVILRDGGRVEFFEEAPSVDREDITAEADTEVALPPKEIDLTVCLVETGETTLEPITLEGTLTIRGNGKTTIDSVSVSTLIVEQTAIVHVQLLRASHVTVRRGTTLRIYNAEGDISITVEDGGTLIIPFGLYSSERISIDQQEDARVTTLSSIPVPRYLQSQGNQTTTAAPSNRLGSLEMLGNSLKTIFKRMQ